MSCLGPCHTGQPGAGTGRAERAMQGTEQNHKTDLDFRAEQKTSLNRTQHRANRTEQHRDDGKGVNQDPGANACHPRAPANLFVQLLLVLD